MRVRRVLVEEPARVGSHSAVNRTMGLGERGTQRSGSRAPGMKPSIRMTRLSRRRCFSEVLYLGVHQSACRG